MNIGDKVLYVPAQCFARHKNAQSPLFKDGEYAWVIGRKRQATDKFTREVTETVDELHGLDLTNFISQVSGSPDPQAWRQVAFVRPNTSWPAIVTGTWADGTVDLDVNCGGNGVTQHMDHVKIDQDGKQPHSCHASTETDPTMQHLLAHAYSQIQGRGVHKHHANDKLTMEVVA